MKQKTQQKLMASLVFAFSGLISAVFILSTGQKGDHMWWFLIIGASAAAFLLSYIFWGFFILKKEISSYIRGIVVGMWIAMISHPVMWYLFLLFGYVFQIKGSMGGDPMNPWQGLWAALVYSVPSLLLAGWLTIPLGAGTGAFLIWYERRFQRAKNQSEI